MKRINAIPLHLREGVKQQQQEPRQEARTTAVQKNSQLLAWSKRRHGFHGTSRIGLAIHKEAWSDQNLRLDRTFQEFESFFRVIENTCYKLKDTLHRCLGRNRDSHSSPYDRFLEILLGNGATSMGLVACHMHAKTIARSLPTTTVSLPRQSVKIGSGIS